MTDGRKSAPRARSSTERSNEKVLQPRDSNVQSRASGSHSMKDFTETHANAQSNESEHAIAREVKRIAESVQNDRILSSQSTLRDNLLSRTTKRRRQSSPSRHGLDSSSSSSSSSADIVDALEPAWEVFKLWPEGLEQEEKAIGDYFRRLKMIQLEQETRNIFIHDTNDDTQTIYSVSDVRSLEEEVRELKEQLKARKRKAVEYRQAIETLTDELSAYDNVREDVKEAQALLQNVQDAELELARLYAIHGPAPEFGQTLESADHLKIPVPRLSAFTRDEADEILNRQLLAMETLESDQAAMVKAIEAAKRQLTSCMQINDRLNAERSAAEKMARETQAGTEKQRNHKLEAICRGYSATVKLFESLVGIVSIDAPSDTCLRAVYTVSDVKARRFCEQMAIELYFDPVKGCLTSFDLSSTSGRRLTEVVAPSGTLARQHLLDAVAANDAGLLIQEALLCIESMEST